MLNMYQRVANTGNIMTLDENEQAIMVNNIEQCIESLINARNLNDISDSPEFISGLLVGLEIAKIFGDRIHEIYISKSSS